MIFDEIPGPYLDTCFSSDFMLVSFANVPWPTAYSHKEIQLTERAQNGLPWLWWQKHQALTKASPHMIHWLERALDVRASYTPAMVLRQLIATGCPHQLIVEEMMGERLKLMPHWNAWPSCNAPGAHYVNQVHHEVRVIPALPAPISSIKGLNRCLDGLTRFIDPKKRYSLKEIAALVQEAESAPFAVTLLEAVQRNWGEDQLCGAHWIMGVQMELMQ